MACAFFGVYDGHGGRRASEYCGDHFHKHFVAVEDWFKDPSNALRIGMFCDIAFAIVRSVSLVGWLVG
jgi:serine/threonine protein phosphatase PrpC